MFNQGLSDVVPLPHEVAQMVHRPMLNDLRDSGRVVSLLAAQSDVRSSIETTRDVEKRANKADKDKQGSKGDDKGNDKSKKTCTYQPYR